MNHAYRFTKSGSYRIRMLVTTTEGTQALCENILEVAENEAYSAFSPVWPCESSYITTMYRYYNSGSPSSHGTRSNRYNAFDIGGSYGENIYAAEEGKVVEKGWDGKGFGYYVVIEHANGLRSLYGHMKSGAIVNRGERVSRGQVIGYMGSTGNSSGTHLHFEMYNPNDYREVINPWTTWYLGNYSVTVGGKSYLANCNFGEDLYAVAWCEWLRNSCVSNGNGDYVFTVG